MQQIWNWQVFLEASPDGDGTYLYTFWTGLGWTMATALSAWALAFCAGVLVGLGRTLPNNIVRKAATFYIEFFRNIPLLVQMFLWYFVVPQLVPSDFGTWLKSVPYASFMTAVVALGFYTSSSVAVQVAAGIEALPSGQRMAGMALGMTLPQTYRYVILPVSFRIIIPALTNDFTSTIKNTSVALTIGLLEVTACARSMQEFTFQVFEPYALATLIYVSVNLCVVHVMRIVERKTALPGSMASAGAGE